MRILSALLVLVGRLLSRVIWRLERRGPPLSFKVRGHRVVVYSWGVDVTLAPARILVVVWGGADGGRVYVSADGTPRGTTRHLLGLREA
jgi:hypothetical protein